MITLSSRRHCEGSVLLMVMIMTGVSLLILAGTMSRVQTVATLNQRSSEYVVCANAAEAAVEKVYARIAYDFQAGGITLVSNRLSSYRTNVPSASETTYWNNFNFSDASGNANRTYVNFAYNYSGNLPSAYEGLFTTNAPVYRIVSNVVRTNGAAVVTGTAQEDVLLALVPLTTWAIFYNGLLEFTQCATMSVNGRVHANGSIYVGTTASLTFNSGVSTTATLTSPVADGVGPWNSTNWNTTFNSTPSYTTNVASVTVSLNMTNSHFLIDIPPAVEDPTSTVGQQRLFNQAQMIVVVTNDAGGGVNPTVTLTMQSSVNGAVPGADSAKTYWIVTNASASRLATNLPFLDLDNSFYDQRERKTNILTEINVGRFATWTATNNTVQSKLPSASGIYPTILYVADRRTPAPSQPSRVAAVRLANANLLPANNNLGFTVATQNPLYTWGSYNIQTSSGGSLSVSTTNTANTFPAAILSDSLTVLSSNWSDSISTSSSTAYAQNDSSYDAADTTLNAAIITGTMPSTGSTDTTFSGGVHNLPRLLQDWTSRHLWLNTSILRLWDSNMATNQFRNPAGFNPSPVNPYYNPPTRHYAFDLNFLNPGKVPPGIPTALVPIRFAWGVPPPNVTTYVPAHN